MFEKNRDSNALAAISKALAANPPPPKPIVPKPVVQLQPPAPVAAPVAAATTAVVVEKKAKKEKKASKKDKKRKDVEHTTLKETLQENAPFVAMEVDEAPLTVAKEPPTLKPVAKPPAPPAPTPPPTAASLFPTWYLSKVAECFGDEIEALQDADAPVHPKVLMQALASAAPLYSQIEQRAAVGGGSE